MGYRSQLRAGSFDGKVALVTGGGSGIGRCCAHELASLGAHVVLLGRNADKLANVSAEIHEDGARADAIACDIRDEDGVRRAVAQIVERHGRVDLLVNNAGGQFPAPLEQISAKGWQAVLNTNLLGGFLVARECYLQSMKPRKTGAIVNIIADMWHGMTGMGHSGAARAGMLNFTETAAAEWAPVRVNAVAPGWIASSGMDTYPDSIKPMLRGLPKMVPLGRIGNEAEVSAAIAFLLSDAASFISGACLRVDGGAPNARRHFAMQPADANAPFDGFHRATVPELFKR
ncbi:MULTISPECIES: SDR family oxidoreductase [Burkholderia]|uniref:Peroxisomal trans-2-enoyl-CoA reductase n=2 Tax=Burkholderia humptydooensis TaxID=430531 RepID=A0A7U4SV95_9BURK|nr:MULTISPECIES: SDR family oxidoreductase [Burkholderia]AJY39947.1 short chain dehydrogenase family protein [Burkholderia sp. 2002721687]ALX46701.1 2,4-dienoyl-CoA reductase [Burkholderia humptydooensis]KVN03100.1 2,4-dienoyl-CoA reductase [Burkholderia sp. MSMB1552]KWZ49759.1 2,4-dienoyl-CoA reductase [Burkholderia sp. MSMB1588]QPS46012.1 SDR family oxidoreductase [Burkholderia humptydooensis]